MQPQTPSLDSGANGRAPRSNSMLSGITDTLSSRASREFHNFVADIEDLIAKTTSLTGKDLDEAKEQLNERIATARSYLDDVSDSLVQRARKSATVTNRYVHEQPWAAIGVGAALGVLCGFLLGNRK